MAWVGTGAMWTMASGVLKGVPIEQAARGAMPMHRTGGLRFAQILVTAIASASGDQAAIPE